jgi:perosamine synthetase
VPSSGPARRVAQVDLSVDEAELAELAPSVLARWLSEGPKATELAAAICAYTGAAFTCFAPNGTLGLYLALLALDLPAGSEIVIPSFTFYGSATPAVFAGLKPVFCDVREDTYALDIDDLERRITPATRAVMPVHVYGQACDVPAVLEVAARHDLAVVEDAAQAFGVHLDGRHAGTFGRVGVFSFFSDKVISMGEGAALVTDDEALSRRLRLLRNQGRPNAGTFVHPELGMNFRITDVQAAIGLAQLRKLPRIRARRLHLADLYRQQLDGVGDIRFMTVRPGSEFVPFRAPFTTARRPELEAVLRAHDIETRGFFHPMHLQPKLRSDPPVRLPVSEKLAATGLCLPVHAHVSDDDALRVCDVIRRFFA